MRPLDRLPAVTPETAIIEALEIMDQEKVNELPIAKDGRIEGFITRGGVMRLLQTRAASKCRRMRRDAKAKVGNCDGYPDDRYVYSCVRAQHICRHAAG